MTIDATSTCHERHYEGLSVEQAARRAYQGRIDAKCEEIAGCIKSEGKRAKRWRYGYLSESEPIPCEKKTEIDPINGRERTSPYTEMDISLSEEITKKLAHLFPDIPMISEENRLEDNQAIRKDSNTYWLLDPIDGTSSFIDGFGDRYCVMLALVENGQPVFGMNYYPEYDALLYTHKGKAWLQAGEAEPKPITLSPRKKDFVLIEPWLKEDIDHEEATQPIEFKRLKEAAQRNKLQLMDELNADLAAPISDLQPKRAYLPRLLGLVRGTLELACRKRGAYEWDFASDQALLEAAGGHMVHTISGLPPKYGQREDLFIAPVWMGTDAALSALELIKPQALQAKEGQAR